MHAAWKPQGGGGNCPFKINDLKLIVFCLLALALALALAHLSVHLVMNYNDWKSSEQLHAIY